VTHQDILDRLQKIIEFRGQECARLALVDALKLDIEIHCRRTGVAFV
jgi:hypothetical protein